MTGRSTQKPDLHRPLLANERVVIFPTTGWRDPSSRVWKVNLRGWVFEPEPHSRWRQYASRRVARVLSRWLPPHADKELATQLFHWFLVDYEQGKQVQFAIGPQVFQSPTSHADGRFATEIEIPGTVQSGVHPCRLIDAPENLATPAFLTLADPEGLSIVCDIDDTLKKSEVFSRRLLLHNTFYAPWEPVVGMAHRLTQWAQAGAQVHYVSAMPWPLFLAFAAFRLQHGFPVGSVDMRDFRLRDRSLFRFFGSSQAYKLARVSALLQRFSQRRFILIGDSGESDPEIYGQLARAHPKQVAAIWIRNLEKTASDDLRWQLAFHQVDHDRWRLFSDGEELPASLSEFAA